MKSSFLSIMFIWSCLIPILWSKFAFCFCYSPKAGTGVLNGLLPRGGFYLVALFFSVLISSDTIERSDNPPNCSVSLSLPLLNRVRLNAGFIGVSIFLFFMKLEKVGGFSSGVN